MVESLIERLSDKTILAIEDRVVRGERVGAIEYCSGKDNYR